MQCKVEIIRILRNPYFVFWSLLMPILNMWSELPPTEFPNYQAGTWGPEAAELLIARDGHTWLQPVVLDEEGEQPGAEHKEPEAD